LVSRVWSIWDKSILSVIVLNIKPTITKLGVCLWGKSIYHVSTQSWVLIFYTSKWLWKTITCCPFSLQLCCHLPCVEQICFCMKMLLVLGGSHFFFVKTISFCT
jgi:hypothetical protein